MNNKMREHEMLREEILQKINLQNTLLTFTITTCIAVIAFALSQKNIIFYFIPFFIIIPMTIRIAYYTSALVKLSAYMEVFLEEKDGYMWETRNRKLVNVRIEKKKNKWFDFTVYQHNECLILCLISYLLAAFYLLFEYNQEVYIKLLIWFIATFFLLLETHVTNRINRANKEKDNWVNRWSKIKELEYIDENFEKFNGEQTTQ